MTSRPIPYMGAKTINKNLTFLNASKEAVHWVSSKMNPLLMYPVYSAVTHEDNWGLGTPSNYMHYYMQHQAACNTISSGIYLDS